jgi:Mn-dependent DtxR family transcriptional regulator
MWSIVHIEAQAISHRLFTTYVERVSEDLQNIEFPSSEPESDFAP